MTVLQINNLSICYQGSPILDGVSAVLGFGARAGIVGPNGAGKTTLLRSILGDIEPESGSTGWINEPRVGYVPQKWDPDLAQTPIALMGYENADALGQCGIGKALWEQPCSSLSGGERTRLLIAKALSTSPQVLILDEPTNHLDIPGIEWLERTLRAFKGEALVVSHDRLFLDAVATEIWELRDGHLATFSGGYSQYHARLLEIQANQAKEYAKWQRRVRELTSEVRDRRQWFEKAHDDAGINDFYRRKAKKHARQFKAKETMLERALAEEPEVRRADQSLGVKVDHAGHRTRTILRSSLIGFSYGNASSSRANPSPSHETARNILDGVSVSLAPSDKVGLTGPNGSGKTTLIRLLLGELQPATGTVWVNPRVRIGYLSQMLSELDPGGATAVNVQDQTGLTLAEARNLLGRMGLSGDTQMQSLGTLSMGERTRVAVSCLCFGCYDALILDEPTNHLDTNARDCVEQALTSFPGALLVATHDRYFLDRVCNTIWSLEGGKVRVVKGNYTAFRGERATCARSDSSSGEAVGDAAMVELGLQTELAFLVSRITSAKDAGEKQSLEQQYSTALARLKELRDSQPGRRK